MHQAGGRVPRVDSSQAGCAWLLYKDSVFVSRKSIYTDRSKLKSLEGSFWAGFFLFSASVRPNACFGKGHQTLLPRIFDGDRASGDGPFGVLLHSWLCGHAQRREAAETRIPSFGIFVRESAAQLHRHTISTGFPIPRGPIFSCKEIYRT